MSSRTAVLLMFALLIITAPLNAAEEGDGEGGGEQRAPVTVGVDIGAVVAGAVFSTLILEFPVGVPLNGFISLELEPSVYFAGGTGLSLFQIALEVIPRFYPFTFIDRKRPSEERRALHRGPFLGVGAAVAFARAASGQDSLNKLAAGPVIEIGYRFVIRRANLYIEPNAGWSILFGGGNASKVLLGLGVGYRF